MSDGGLPENVAKFIWQHIRSVEQLEILLCLSRNSGKSLSAPAIFEKIQSSVSSIEQNLAYFTKEGFLNITTPGDYLFEPSDPETAALIMAVLSEFQNRRVRVIEAIYNRQSDAVQSFADAFRIKKKE